MSLDLGTLVGYLELDGEKFDQTIDKMPEKIKGSGALMKMAAGGVALLVGAALSEGLTAAIDTEAANAKLSANLGLTEAESARIGGVAGKLYADAYGESIEDVSTSIESVISSFDGMRNASAETVEATTAKLLNLQTAMGIDVARSAQVAGQAVKAGLAGDAGEAIDLLTANLQRVPAAVREDLLDAVDEYGPILANMGFSGEEAFGMLADAADKGAFGIDKTGDALKELSIRATDMSTASVDAYNAMGMNAEEMAAKMAAGGDSAREATESIIQGLLGIKDPVAQSNAAIALFGTPLEDLGTQDIPVFLDSLAQVKDGFKSTEGAADEMSATLNGSASVGWTQLQRTWDSIIGQAGGALLPVLSAVIDFLNENPAVLQAVALGLGVLAAAFVGVTVATWAMNTALLANPITWIVLAIVALVAALVWLVANWDMVVAWLGDVWNGFVSWFTGVMDGFFAWWNGVWEGFLGFLQGIWDGIVAFVAAALQWVIDLFLNWTLIGLLIQYWDEIVAGATNAWNGLMAFLGGIPGFILGIFVGAGQWLVSVGKSIIDGAQTGITNGWNAVMGWFQSLPGAILGFFAGAGRWLWDIGRNLIQGLLDGVKSLGSTIGNFFLDLLPDWIVGPFKAALGIHSPSTVFREFGRNIVQGIPLGVDDEQGMLDARMRDLVSVPDGSMGSSGTQAVFGAQAGAGGVTRVSLDGMRVYLLVDGREIVGIIRDEIEDDREDRRGELVNGTGEVVAA